MSISERENRRVDLLRKRADQLKQYREIVEKSRLVALATHQVVLKDGEARVSAARARGESWLSQPPVVGWLSVGVGALGVGLMIFFIFWTPESIPYVGAIFAITCILLLALVGTLAYGASGFAKERASGVPYPAVWDFCAELVVDECRREGIPKERVPHLHALLLRDFKHRRDFGLLSFATLTFLVAVVFGERLWLHKSLHALYQSRLGIFLVAMALLAFFFVWLHKHVWFYEHLENGVKHYTKEELPTPGLFAGRAGSGAG